MNAVAIYTKDGFYIENDDKLKQNTYQKLYEYAFLDNKNLDISIEYLVEIVKQLIIDITKNSDIEIVRIIKNTNEETLETLKKQVPFTIGAEFVNLDWIKTIYLKFAEIYNKEISEFKGTVEDYFYTKNNNLNVAGRVYFHLVEHKDEEYPFAFLATYSTGNNKQVNHLPLKNALKEYKDETQMLKLLSTVGRVADKSEFISNLMESGELFSPLKFTSNEAYIFLKETSLYEENGILCRIPNFWKRKSFSKIKVNVGSKAPSTIGLDALMEFNPEIYLGDEKFTKKEIQDLLNQTDGLAFLKGKWVEVNKEKLQELLKTFDEFQNKDITFLEALRMQSGIENVEDNAEIEISNGEWLEHFKEQMLMPSKIKKMSPPSTFKANLREYQTVGFNWLNLMTNVQFGALLADDMGLGKTIQILALLDNLKSKKIKTLLVIPASLIENWRKEAFKFAPKLKIEILHGNNVEIDVKKADVFITTYGMVKRLEELNDITWDLLILDEAQAIKNYGTAQTKSVKLLKAKAKIAMTGTPIENRLEDLWSLFDFLNKGLLGGQKEFGDFTKNIKDDISGYEKLRNAISPFILRRLKTDKSIISDLPDKIETKDYTTLSKKQIALYTNLVKELEKSMEVVEGINRKGLILASIGKFKQICNHPDQYTDNKEFEEKHSGKFEKLKEICETIKDKHERVLIFTQFKEMVEPLNRFLKEVFEKEGLMLHGGTAVKKRGELVEKFNGEEYIPYMVLSLKAGGVGLNLTSANHVVHFDRWWNPAIENQATDRAFRIGQQKNVIVHKFVTSGTIEEKIDTMIEGKQKLSSDVISETSGEKWITEMSNEELYNLFKLEV
ncbi:MAG: DEAD/DEAH box helicase [Oscillospiraceae bacterium]|nr:DEAD/DEAH box helicase [Oscillospiraceae bacterium]